MNKIGIVQPLELSPEQAQRLEKLGAVTYFEERAKDADEWLQRCQGFDVVCSGGFGFRDKWRELHDVFISTPIVSVNWVEPAVLRANNVTVSNCPGCNRHAVAEWIMGMLLFVNRRLSAYVNAETLDVALLRQPDIGLTYKRIAILGKGNIGTKTGEIAKAFEMEVSYFRRGDDLASCVADADVVIDCLSSTPANDNLLDEAVFGMLKDGAVFVSVTGRTVVDIEAMLAALDSGKLAWAAHDAGSVSPGDTASAIYQKLLAHPKVYVTPHIAFNTDVERKISNDMMIDNIEAWLNGAPINVI